MLQFRRILSCLVASVAAGPLSATSSRPAGASPAAEVVAPTDAWWLAEAFAADRPGCETFVGSGDSMQPLYRDRTVLVVQRVDFAALRPGMTAVFVSDSGRPVAHVLVRPTRGGWLARGAGNVRADATLVRNTNLVGIVIRAFAPDPRVPSLRTPVLPVTNSGAPIAMRGVRPSPEMLLALAPASAQ